MSDAKPMLLDRYDDGMEEILHFDPLTNSGAVQIKADVTANLDANRALYNDGTGGWSKTKEWRRVASIPTAVAMEWFTKYGIKAWDKDHLPAVKRLLNDPEYLYLRTAPGRL